MAKTSDKLHRGQRLVKGPRWRLIHEDKLYKATLKAIVDMGSCRLAIFSVPKR